MAYDWYQAWLADKQKRDQQAQQDPQTNKVNFHQASMANNIQYTLPNFTGTSGNKGVNSQWEKDMLGPLSIKQYGRSYEDRFNNLTKSMGMNTYQAQDFRRYLDSQEAAKQGYLLKKDGTPDNRHTVTMGQGMQTQNQQIDGILKNMTNPNTPTNQLNTAIQNAGIPDMKVPSAQEQAQNQQDSKPHSWIYNNILNPVNNAVGGAVDYLERAGASGVDALTAGQFKKHINDASAKQALGTAGQQFAANETKDPTNLGQSAADVVGNLYATAPLFMGLGKVADPLAKLLTVNKYGQAAIRGGLSMGALATGQNAVDAAINPNDATLGQRAKDIGLNTALGAGAEAGLTALGPVAQRIISKLTKGKPVSQIAKEEGIPEEQVHQVVNNYSNVLADKKPVMPNPIENPLNINLKQPSPSMDNFSLNPNQIPPVTVPPATNDLFSFVKGNVKPRGAIPKLDNVPRYGKENLQQKADTILQKVLPSKFDKPVGYYQDLWNNVANHDGSVFHPQIQQILDHADMLSKDMTQKEQDFVHQYVQDRLSNVAVNDGHVAAIGKKGDLSPEDMRILMDTANQHEANLNTINQQASDYALNHPNYQKAAQKLIDNSGQTNEWQATKQLKQEYQNLKGSLDGINFTASDKANFGDIPQTFKTSSGGIDISKATELLGLKNPEETVNYLQSLAKANRTKMADVVTNPKLGTKAATESQMKKLDTLEKVLQSEYRNKILGAGSSTSIKDLKTPEQVASAYNQKEWYHGTGTADLKKDSLDPLAGDHQGLFGHGVYLTDNPEIANGYAKSRGKRTGTPAIYETKVKMNRVLDLEKPIPDDAKTALDHFAKPLDYQYEKEFENENHFSNIINEMAGKGATTEEIVQRVRREITDFSHEAEIPTSEFVEDFQNLTINLKKAGYDGITHTGGARTGKDPHRVLIALDPNDFYAQTGRTDQITKFESKNPRDVLSKPKTKTDIKSTKSQMQQALDLIAKGKGTNDFHAEAQKAFQDTPYFKSNQKLIDSMQQDLSKLQNPTKEDIYQALRQHNDPQTLQHFVDVATKDMKDFKNSRLKEALISDPRIKQMVKNMSPKKVETAVPKNPQRPAPNFDEVLNLLEGKPNVKKGDKSFLNLKPKGKAQNIDKVLSSLKNEKSIPKQSAADSNIKPAAQPKQENVNNSQVKPETSSNLKPIGITPNQAHVNDISWVADPKNLARKIQDGDVSLGKTIQAGKTHVTSDLQFVKDIMRKIAKQDMGQTLTMMGRKMKDVSYEDNLFKGLRGVRRAVSEAVTASKHDYGKIIKTLRENKINQRDASEYFDAVHFNDILTNNHDKMVRAGDVAQRLQDIEHLVQNTNDKKVLKQLADEENKLLKEQKTLEPYTLPKEATPTKVQAVLDRWKNTPAMIQAQKDFMASQRKDLELQVKSGLKSQAEVDAMISKHPNYVHMGRAKEGSDFSNGAGGNISKARQSIKARKNGSEENKKYTSLEGAIQNRIMTYHNARRNMAMQTIEKIAKANGGSDFFTKLNPHAASDSQMQNTVKFFKNGEAQHYEVPPLLKQAFDSLDTRQAKDLVTKTIRAARNTIAKGATYFNTDFIFSSPLRETNALITSRTNLHPGQLVVGYLDSFLGKGLEKASGGLFKSYKEVYHELGGHYTGNVTVGPQDMRQFVKQMDKGTLGKGIQIINPANWITKLGASIEHGPKLAEFRSAKGKGYSDLNAMHEAADVIDYTDLGTTVRAANNYIPFLGPMVRGTTRYFQAMKENPAAWLGKNLMYITAPTIGIYAMRFAPYTTDEQRSKINNMTMFQKNLYWSIPAPDGKTIWAIPKMHVGAQLFANPIERVLDQITKQDPKTISRLLKDTGNDVLTNLTPPNSISGLQLIMDSMANYNRLMDMPIEDTSMQRNPDLTKHFNSYTSEMAKELGKLTGGSPAKWDYVIKGMTGGTGRDVLDVTDNAIAKLKPGSRPSKVDTTLDILNPVRRYQYKDTSGLGTSDRLYQQNIQDKFDKKSTQATELYKQISDINKQIKAIREDTKLSSQDKKDQISTLRAQQRKIGDQAISSGVIRNR